MYTLSVLQNALWARETEFSHEQAVNRRDNIEVDLFSSRNLSHKNHLGRGSSPPTPIPERLCALSAAPLERRTHTGLQQRAMHRGSHSARLHNLDRLFPFGGSPQPKNSTARQRNT